MGRFTVFALLWTGLMSASPAAAESTFSWAGHTIPGSKIEERGALSIVEDPDAESSRDGEDGARQRVALEQRVSRQAIARNAMLVARTPLVAWATIEPGVYKLTARVSFEGDLGLIGTPIDLGVYPEGAEPRIVSYAACDFTETGRYHELTMLYEVDPSLSKMLKARQAYHPLRPGGWYHEAYPEAAVAAAAPAASRGFQIALNLPRTKYSSTTGQPPNSLRWVRLDWIRLEKIQPSPSITVRHVKAQRVWLRPGESNTFQVQLENFTGEPYERQLQVWLERGYAQRQVIHESTVSLAADELKELEVEWPTDEQTGWWGYKVGAEIRQGEVVEHAAHDYFQVHPRVYDVHVMGSNSRTVDPFRENESFQNLVEAFGATVGDCARVMPRQDHWISGMMSAGLPQTFRLVQYATGRNLEQGIASHMYLFAGGTGTAVMDLYVDHPEWVHGRPVATDVIYRMRKEREEAVNAHDFTKSFIEPSSINIPHIEQHLNHWFPELKEQIEEQTAEFVRRTGYMGIRFDVGIFSPKSVHTVLGTSLPFDMENAQAHAAKNFVDYKDRLRKEFPGFEFGANMDSWAYLEQVGNRNVTPKPPEEYPEFVAFAEANGMFMDEGTMSAPFFDHYMNRWEDALWGMAQKRDMAGRFGGIYQLFSPHRDGNGYFAHDDIYFAICMIASGSHYVGSFSAPPYTRDSIGQFISRYSEFFWSTNRRLLPDAQEKIFVDAPAEIWYADVAAYEAIGEQLRYIIPLINPPVAERLRRNKSNELPPPIDEAFKVEVAVPDGYSQAEAWMLTWEPRVMAERLPCEVDGTTAIVDFPALQLFRTLVIDFSR